MRKFLAGVVVSTIAWWIVGDQAKKHGKITIVE